IARQLVGDGYFRMQAELSIGMDDLDDVSATNIAALEAVSRDYLDLADTRTMLARLAALLGQYHSINEMPKPM
ncbi:MAG: hypothetical protein ABIQ48_06195, partial [Luteimonas sp.]